MGLGEILIGLNNDVAETGFLVGADSERVNRVKGKVETERSASTSVGKGETAETIDGILDDWESFMKVVITCVFTVFDRGFNVEVFRGNISEKRTV